MMPELDAGRPWGENVQCARARVRSADHAVQKSRRDALLLRAPGLRKRRRGRLRVELPDRPPRHVQLHFYGDPNVDPLTTSSSCYVFTDDADALYEAWNAIGVPTDPVTMSRLQWPPRDT